MQIYSRIDIGKTRKSNQDAYFAEKLSDGAALVVVCDGMGGANAGNVASDMAVNVISEYVKRSYRESMDASDASQILKRAVTSANIDIYDAALRDENLSGMGTTVVAAIVKEAFTAICHVGDSRAYLISNNTLTQLTRDHSMVQSLVESGKLTPEEAMVHPRKNVITRALGAEENVIPDLYETVIKTGETLMICTDGLSNFVPADQIISIFKSNAINEIADILTDTANANGGGDNITVVTVTV